MRRRSTRTRQLRPGLHQCGRVDLFPVFYARPRTLVFRRMQLLVNLSVR